MRTLTAVLCECVCACYTKATAAHMHRSEVTQADAHTHAWVLLLIICIHYVPRFGAILSLRFKFSSSPPTARITPVRISTHTHSQHTTGLVGGCCFFFNPSETPQTPQNLLLVGLACSSLKKKKKSHGTNF